MSGINEMQAVRGYWGGYLEGVVEEEYLIIYPGGIV